MELEPISDVLDVLTTHPGGMPHTVARAENAGTENPDIHYLLSKREPIFPPYIASLCRSFGEGSVLEGLRRLDGVPASNAYLGGVVRHVAEGT